MLNLGLPFASRTGAFFIVFSSLQFIFIFLLPEAFSLLSSGST
jgi:hypothetical protein